MLSYAFTLENFEYWLLILVRLASFIFIAPIFGTKGVPNRTKIGFALFISFLMYNVAARPEPNYVGVIGYGVAVLSEGITGLLLGLAANICNSIVLFSGSLIDMDIGLSMATQFNPDMGNESSITGSLYYYMVLLLLMTSGLAEYLIRAITDSFTVIPTGHTLFQWEHLMESMLTYFKDLFVLGFRIFLPVFACMMILNCVLGIMAKVAPQMNMFAVGIQLKIIVGYLVLLFTVLVLPSAAGMVFSEIRKMVVFFAEGMY